MPAPHTTDQQRILDRPVRLGGRCQCQPSRRVATCEGAGRMTMDERLNALIEAAKSVVMTREDIEKQRESFAYGNTNIENSRITRETIATAAKKLKESGEY